MAQRLKPEDLAACTAGVLYRHRVDPVFQKGHWLPYVRASPQEELGFKHQVPAGFQKFFSDPMTTETLGLFVGVALVKKGKAIEDEIKKNKSMRRPLSDMKSFINHTDRTYPVVIPRWTMEKIRERSVKVTTYVLVESKVHGGRLEAHAVERDHVFFFATYRYGGNFLRTTGERREKWYENIREELRHHITPGPALSGAVQAPPTPTASHKAGTITAAKPVASMLGNSLNTAARANLAGEDDPQLDVDKGQPRDRSTSTYFTDLESAFHEIICDLRRTINATEPSSCGESMTLWAEHSVMRDLVGKIRQVVSINTTAAQARKPQRPSIRLLEDVLRGVLSDVKLSMSYAEGGKPRASLAFQDAIEATTRELQVMLQKQDTTADDAPR